MTTLVSLDGVAKRYAERQVLAGVTLGIAEGDRIGVIGLNGSGKSTLLRLIAAVEPPDSGRVVFASGVRVGHVPQEPAFDPASTVFDVVPDRSARALLDRLGLTPYGDHRIGDLSGGQRKRVALARGLAADADLLVLDEPTNHLDINAVEWLESILRARGGALVLVTHDRYLLDRLATRIVEVAGGELRTGYGSYADYLKARVRIQDQAIAVERRRANRARVELAWLRRSPAARTSRDRLRTRRAEELLAAAGPEREEIDFGLPTRRLGTRVVDLLEAGKRYGDRWVLCGVEHRLARGARIGVVGANGAGKTTLLALIAGRLAPDEGRVVVGDTVVPGWYGQDPEPLPDRLRVIDAVDEMARQTVLPDGRQIGASGLLERFGFPAVLQGAWVGQLSGGERRRLELLRVLAGVPNLLLLDEPTNDLDVDTLTILEEFLDTWPGALVVASHDRYLLDRVCDDIFAISDSRVRHHPGGWSAWRAAQRDTVSTAPRGSRPSRHSERSRKLGYAERRELVSLERRLSDLETRKADLTAALQRGGADYDVVRVAGEELTGVLAELDAAETRWLELAEIGE